MATLVAGLTEGPVAGWGAAPTLAWLGAALVLVTAFVVRELRVSEPLLDVRLFAIPAFGTAVAAMVLVFGASTGLSAGPGTDAISSALPAARQGVASAVNDLSRELGATLGIAITGTAFNTAYRASVRTDLPGTEDPIAAAVHSSPGAGINAIAAAPAPDPRYGDAIVAATGHGWTAGALVVSAAFLVGLVFFVLRYPDEPEHPDAANAATERPHRPPPIGEPRPVRRRRT